jgi:hypothetical protein
MISSLASAQQCANPPEQRTTPMPKCNHRPRPPETVTGQLFFVSTSPNTHPLGVLKLTDQRKILLKAGDIHPEKSYVEASDGR